MKNQAKWAGQIRHVMTALGGILVALGVADAPEAATLTSTVDTFFSSAMSLVGAVTIVAGNFMSWVSRAKKVGEGDFG